MRALIVAAACLGLAACSTGTDERAAAPPAPVSNGPASGGAGPGGPVGSGGPATGTGLSPEAAVSLVRGHLDAVGRGDVAAWVAPLALDVRFDIGGAVYEGIDAVRGWGERDPIGQGGRYDILSATPTPTGVSTDVTFRAGSLVEEIRYVFTVRDGRIADLVARYR